VISVVMVLYGGAKLARRALEALAENTETPYEFVLVDNASEEDVFAELGEHAAGATTIRNEVNRGFGGASNQGAERATGELLCFLNTDALVEPGWLEPLLETLAEPGVGAVVPMLLNPDGSVQEAGSVVDSIGHAHAVGGGLSPEAFEVRFRREVDFGSAACMLIRRDLFLSVGGFDEAFSPAYFEDTDLSFRLHDLGLRTLYEPRSRVVHLRHGSGTSKSARELMQRNRDLFVQRWGERLTNRPRLVEVAQKPHQMIAARDAEALDRFLVIDDRVPYTDRGSGDPRMFALLSELAGLWPSARITFAAAHGQDAERYAEPLLRRGIEVVAPPVDWERWFEERRFHYGVVLVSRHQNIDRFGRFLESSQPQAFRIFDTEALTFLRLERQVDLTEHGRTRNELRVLAAKAREAEIRAVQESDLVFCVSDDEASLIGELAPDRACFALPGVVEPLPDPPGYDARSDLIFFGGFLAGPASPNYDSLVYLVNDVLPLFWEEHPDVGLNVVGADVTDAVRTLEAPRVRIVGYVEDPTGWLSRARVHVNPMRFGAGLKQKFLDSIGAGLPFVTTSVGAEGFPLEGVRSSMVADDPAGLARLLGRLYDERAEWERVQARLLELAAARFDRASFQRTLLEAMTHVGVAPPHREHAVG
jgi:GT2 family glycosyltransferase